MEGDESLWRVRLPIKYVDGDDFEIYIKKVGNDFCVFDDGSALWHASGTGARTSLFYEKLSQIARLNKIELDEYGDLSLQCSKEEIPDVLLRIIKTLDWTDYVLCSDYELYRKK